MQGMMKREMPGLLWENARRVVVGGHELARAAAAGVVVDETGGAAGRGGAVAIHHTAEIVEVVLGSAREVWPDGLAIVDRGVDQRIPVGDQIRQRAAVLDLVHLYLRAQALKLGAGGLVGGVSAGIGKVRIDQRAQDAQNHHHQKYFDEGKTESMSGAGRGRSHDNSLSKVRRMERSKITLLFSFS